MNRRWTAGLLAGLACALAQAQGTTPGEDSLAAALRAAVHLHPSVRARHAGVRARQAAVEAVRAQRYPSLSVQAQRQATAGAGSDQALRLRQPLWAFGRLDDALEAARADARLEGGDLLRAQRQLLEDTALACARVLAARERHQVGLDHVRAQQAWLERIRRREQGQVASAADVRLAVARLAQAQVQAARLESEWRQADEELRALAVGTAGCGTDLPPALLALIDPAQLEAMVLATSAQLRYHQEALARAKAQLDLAGSSAMPSVYVQADHGGASAGSTRVSVVLEATLDGLGLARSGNVAQAQALVEAAREELDGARREVLRQARTSHRHHALLLRMLQSRREASADMGQLLASYHRQYEAGTKSWLEVLNMQRELIEQRLQDAQLAGDAWTHALRLQAMTGGLDGMAGLAAPAQGQP